MTVDYESYKIGASMRPDRRIPQLNSATAGDLKLVHKIPADSMYDLESALHEVFDDKRLTGEWFQLDDKDVKNICSIASATNGSFISAEDTGDFAELVLESLGGNDG